MAKQAIIGALALAATLTASAAQAETHNLVKAGSWSAFGGTTTTNKPVCGISSEVDGFYFGVKAFANQEHLTIQAGLKRWQVKNERNYPLTMVFDKRHAWKETGYGMHFADGDPGLDYSIPRKQLDNFMRDFRNSRTLEVTFENGLLENASIDLTGAGANSVYDAFQNCAKKLK